jgi:dTDP-4-dehydrorhamnose reductase
MRVLITGSQGQLAKSLVERAHNRDNIEIVAVGQPELQLELSSSVHRLVTLVRPQVVVNAAAWTSVDEAEEQPEHAFRINAEAAGELAVATARIGARIIQISTDYVFDGESDRPYDEQAATNPLGVYGRSKLAGEERVRAANPNHVVVRTAWLYSPFGRNFVKTMMTAAETRDVLKVVDDQCGSPSSAAELAEGLLHMIEDWQSEPERGVGEIFHLAGAGSVSWCGFAQAIMDECRERGLPVAEVEPISTDEWPTRAVRPRYSALNSRKFADVFSYAMPPWQESLCEVISRLSDRP